MQPASVNTLEGLVQWLKFVCKSGVYMGLMKRKADRDYFASCSGYLKNIGGVGVSIIFTRDVGHHANGWWKNPDYDKCFHLSLSFRDPETSLPIPFRKDKGLQIARMFFGDAVTKTWFEGPFLETGKEYHVNHYRLFVNDAWEGIIPEGEVYSKGKTPKNWKSFSEIHGADAPYDPPLGTA